MGRTHDSDTLGVIPFCRAAKNCQSHFMTLCDSQSPRCPQESTDLQIFPSCSSTKGKIGSVIIFRRDPGDSDRLQVWREQNTIPSCFEVCFSAQ